MKNRAFAVTLISLFSLALIGASACAAESMGKGYDRAYEVRDIIGTPIRNTQGQYLGRIDDLVLDSNGRVDFAVLAQPGVLGIHGKLVAVPFSALRYDQKGKYLILNTTRERLEAAPAYDRKSIANRHWAEGTYRYFGLQPYWTEGRTGRNLQDLPENYYPY